MKTNPNAQMLSEYSDIWELIPYSCIRRAWEEKRLCAAEIPWWQLIQRDRRELVQRRAPVHIWFDLEAFNRYWGTSFCSWAEAYLRLETIGRPSATVLIQGLRKLDFQRIPEELLAWHDLDEELETKGRYNPLTETAVLSYWRGAHASRTARELEKAGYQVLLLPSTEEDWCADYEEGRFYSP